MRPPASVGRADEVVLLRRRLEPASGGGAYYHVRVRDKDQFERFRTHDVGARGGIRRIAGRRSDGSWDTHQWLIAKDRAHVEDGRLVADTADARQVLDQFGGEVRHIRADTFSARPRPDAVEPNRPPKALKRPRRRNSTKAKRAKVARRLRRH